MRDDSFPDTAATANNNKLSITTDMALSKARALLTFLTLGHLAEGEAPCKLLFLQGALKNFGC